LIRIVAEEEEMASVDEKKEAVLSDSFLTKLL